MPKPFFENIVGPQFVGWTVFEFYTKRYGHSPPGAWSRWIEEGRVTRNGEEASAGDVLETGDVLRFYREDREEPPVDTGYRIAFEDEDIIVVDKPSGLPVMPGGRYLHHTLLSLLRQQRGDSIHPAHRIDSETSGLVVFTKSAGAARRIAAAFRDRRVRKEYEALMLDHLGEEVTVDMPIRKSTPVQTEGECANSGSGEREAKQAVTTFIPLSFHPDAGLTLVRAVPFTGRKHQIRIHASIIGHPVFGDSLYGGSTAEFRKITPTRVPEPPRLALHAARIAIPLADGYREFRSHTPAWFRDPGLLTR